MKAVNSTEFSAEFDFICSFYKDDLQPDNLSSQLLTFAHDFKRAHDSNSKILISHIIEFYVSLASAQKLLLSQVGTVVQLLLIMPATNSTSERSFSALRRLKTYLRNTMSQQRLNKLLRYYRFACSQRHSQ